MGFGVYRAYRVYRAYSVYRVFLVSGLKSFHCVRRWVYFGVPGAGHGRVVQSLGLRHDRHNPQTLHPEP